jgi:prepilin-type N-terminal cleavage/methylation domain-containing protein
MKINTSRNAGFTLVEIMIVVAIIGLLAAIAIPNFVKARNTSQRNACINNLRQMDSAVQQWALETGQSDTGTTAGNEAAINAYIKGGNIPTCPGGGTEAYGTTVVDPPTCSLAAAPELHVLPN